MPQRRLREQDRAGRSPVGKMPAAGAVVLSAALVFQGCFAPVYPDLDREARVMEALDDAASRDTPPNPLTPAQAVAYALAHNLDAKVAEIEAAYQNESLIAARRKLLPGLTLRYSPNYTNHPAARWSESTRSGSQSLESSYSSEQYTRQSEVGMVWNLIDFGVGYLRARQQGERILHADQQRRRVRQQVALDVLSNYWRASAAARIAAEAENLRDELEKQGEDVRDSVELRILSGAEGARRELAVHGSLAELEQYRRSAAQTRLELAGALGYGGTAELSLPGFAAAPVRLPRLPDNDPWALQAAALKRRPELFQQDAQERIAVDEARLALLQIAPNANLSLSLYDDPDKFLEWGNWMTAGVRISWNLFNIPARLAERRMAKTQKEMAKQKGLALAAAVMSQVGIAFSDWRLARDYADALERRAASRERLVEALAAGERDGQTRPGEVLQER
ncbi:MAG: TolC family protein, partial [Planctomycetota bacterium]|nr:TolC family protein [Planctomycetota bacterium]